MIKIILFHISLGFEEIFAKIQMIIAKIFANIIFTINYQYYCG